jgi:perosamine synthetase
MVSARAASGNSSGSYRNASREDTPVLATEEEQDWQPYTCERSDSVLSAIEKCLDNGIGACVVVDEGRPVGNVSLDDIRRAILDGSAIRDPLLEPLVGRMADPLANGQLRNDVNVDNKILSPIVTENGYLSGIKLDRSEQYVQIAHPDLTRYEFRAVLDAFISSWVSSKGAYIGKFEEEFSAFVGLPHGVAVSNGTTALHLALVALGVGPGDEVIVPDLTFAATINAVLYCGATPVIVDIDPQGWTMSAANFAAACTPNTKAVIPVHLHGRPAEIGPIADLARSRGIYVIEDCAEAHGATYNGTRVGSFSDIACFSFFANKIVTTGEGGMCLTASDSHARMLRELRDHGMVQGKSYWHERVGYNYRMTNLQAAIGQSQLWRIDRILDRNRSIAERYRRALDGIPGIAFPPTLPDAYGSVVWLTCLQVPAHLRGNLIAAAHVAEIEMRPFFHSLSAMPLYEKYAGDCPHSRALSETGINLPTSRSVDDQVIERVATLIRKVLEAA